MTSRRGDPPRGSSVASTRRNRIDATLEVNLGDGESQKLRKIVLCGIDTGIRKRWRRGSLATTTATAAQADAARAVVVVAAAAATQAVAAA